MSGKVYLWSTLGKVEVPDHNTLVVCKVPWMHLQKFTDTVKQARSSEHNLGMNECTLLTGATAIDTKFQGVFGDYKENLEPHSTYLYYDAARPMFGDMVLVGRSPRIHTTNILA